MFLLQFLLYIYYKFYCIFNIVTEKSFWGMSIYYIRKRQHVKYREYSTVVSVNALWHPSLKLLIEWNRKNDKEKWSGIITIKKINTMQLIKYLCILSVKPMNKMDKLLTNRLNMYEKLDIATWILYRTKVKVQESLACAKISPKASNGICWLLWVVTYPVDKVIWFSK